MSTNTAAWAEDDNNSNNRVVMNEDPFCDNPWSTAAASETVSRSTLNAHDRVGTGQLQQQDSSQVLITTPIEDMEPSTWKFIVIRLWNLFDGIMGFLLVLYGLLSWIYISMHGHDSHAAIAYSSSNNNTNDNHNHNNSGNNNNNDTHDANVIIFFLVSIGVLFLLRVTFGEVSMRVRDKTGSSREDMIDDDEDSFCCGCDCCTNCNRIGLYFSALTSPTMALLNFCLMIWILVDKTSIQHELDTLNKFMDQHHHHQVLEMIQHWLDTEKRFLIAFVFLLFTLLECVRWQLLFQYRQQLLQYDNRLLYMSQSQYRLYEQQRSNRKPWWWQKSPTLDAGATTATTTSLDDDPLRASLLPVASEARRSGGRQKKSSWFSWGGSGDNNNEYHNIRDDGSVDFASVQEDWASRSVEDPHWWANDNDTNSNNPFDE